MGVHRALRPPAVAGGRDELGVQVPGSLDRISTLDRVGSVLGLRVPIPPGLEEVSGVGGSLLAGLGNTWLRDDEDEALIWGWSVGGEITFCATGCQPARACAWIDP